MVDISKEYTTRNGKRVIGLEINEYNSCGFKVSYPVKGSIVQQEKPLKLEYAIWSIDGISDIVWGKNKGKDLILKSE